MRSRFPGRLLIAAGTLLSLVLHTFGRRKPIMPRRILVLHHLLLGDTIMLTPLLKKLRTQFPGARIVMTCPVAFTGLYATRPYGVEVIPFDERDMRTIAHVWRQPRFDLTVIPAENRLSLLARAIGSRWIVAFDGDWPAYKSWFVDELRPFPTSPIAWGDLVCLLVDGPAPEPYRPAEWTAPPATAPALPSGPYCVLHLGASSVLRLWNPDRWQSIIAALARRGFAVVLSAGPKERHLIEQVDPARSHVQFAGTLSLERLWQVLARARLLVCLDTGVAHLGRVIGVPEVVIFGPGSALLFGGGDFWRNVPDRKVFVPDFPCRDENLIFRRQVPWAGHCGRPYGQCLDPRCMKAVTVEAVLDAIEACLEDECGRSDRTGGNDSGA